MKHTQSILAKHSETTAVALNVGYWLNDSVCPMSRDAATFSGSNQPEIRGTGFLEGASYA